MMTKKDKKIQFKQMKKINLCTWCWFSQMKLKISFQIKKIWNYEKKQETEKRKNLWNEKSERKNCTEQTTHCKTHSSNNDKWDKVKMMINRENNENKNNNNDNNNSNSNSSNDSDKLSWKIFMSKQNQQRDQNQNQNQKHL